MEKKENFVVRYDYKLDIKFGSKGVFPVKGCISAIGENQRGKWFSILVPRKHMTRTSTGNTVAEWIHIERIFSVDMIADAKQKAEIEDLFK